MASNKKWFKRAIRTLRAGEEQLWDLIKNKLTPEQVNFFENQFLGTSSNVEATVPNEAAEIKTPSKTITTEEPKVKKVTAKTKSRKTSTPKSVGKKKTTTKKTKSVSKEK